MVKEIKPIHKFNGGLGATLCNSCRKIINVGITNNLFCSIECENKQNRIIPFVPKEDRELMYSP